MPANYRWTGLAAATVISLACARTPETLPSPAAEKVVEFSVLEDYDKGDDLDEDWARFTRALASARRVHSNVASYARTRQDPRSGSPRLRGRNTSA
jgi:hypothetical protein